MGAGVGYWSVKLCRLTCVLLEISATCKKSLFSSCKKIFVRCGSRIVSDKHFACYPFYPENRLISSHSASSQWISAKQVSPAGNSKTN